MAAKIDIDHWRGVLSAVPQLAILEACGDLKTEQLDRIAERWGFPINGSPVDVRAVLRRLVEFLKRYGQLLKDIIDAGDEDGEENSLSIRFLKSKIAKNEADTIGKQLLNEQKQNRLIERDVVHQVLNQMADRINKFGERAQRKWGEEGYEFFFDLAVGFQDDMRAVLDDSVESAETEASSEE